MAQNDGRVVYALEGKKFEFFGSFRFFRVILNFAQEFYYLENKVGVVDFTKASGPSWVLGL